MSHTISLPVVRFSLAGILSLLMTFLLFFFMQNLIKNNGGIIIEKTGPTPTFTFVRLQRDETVKQIDRVKHPQKVVDPPPVPKPKSLENPNVGKTIVGIKEISTHMPGGRIDPGMFAINDGDIIPVMKVQPNYPRGALMRGIEGYVIVEFTVTTSGTTKDIRVIEAQPDNIFNKSSVLAAAKFKYKPRVINGNPVEVRGVRNKFIFNLE